MAHKILIVDDEEPIRKLLKVRLEAAGYEVLSAGDGAQALTLARNVRPDLAILDVDLPDIDGGEIGKQLAKNPATHSMPIIYLTGLQTKDDELKLGGGRENVVFAKPFEAEKLLKKVEELIRLKGYRSEGYEVF